MKRSPTGILDLGQEKGSKEKERMGEMKREWKTKKQLHGGMYQNEEMAAAAVAVFSTTPCWLNLM